MPVNEKVAEDSWREQLQIITINAVVGRRGNFAKAKTSDRAAY